MTRTLLCFGDSNTHGTCPMADFADRRRFAAEIRWPGVVAARLGAGWQVIEEGHPGRTTVHPDPVEGAHKNGLPAFVVALESHRPVDVVVIMVGTNDLKERYSVGAGDIALSLEKLIVAARASECGPGFAAPEILLVAPPPVEETGCLAEMFRGGAGKSRDLGQRIREIAARRAVAFFDAGTVVAASPIDGVHFAADGHAALGTALADLIIETWGTGQTG